MQIENHNEFMQEAIKEAQKGLIEGGIPIGSVLVYEGKIISRGHNQRIQKNSCILHAEMDAFENLGRQKSNIYEKCILYSTLSPCDMCTGTALLYKIKIFVIGENQTFKGPEEYSISKGVQIINLNDQTCIQMMKDFIQKRPQDWNEDIGV